MVSFVRDADKLIDREKHMVQIVNELRKRQYIAMYGLTGTEK